ncbi:MAG: efflux RND transporter periplasmic adaptor subunit [Phycisphaerales bacterium]|nr:efflux RND transporter periplasmic adaptor subunit [Phycisphaerales bacterium]
MNNHTRIPLPPRRWLLRLGLPMLILGATALLLLGTMWSSVMPARSVRTVSAMVRSVDAPIVATTTSTASSDAVVQAPGWVEPDPFGIYAGALTEGVVRDVLVLEGDAVSAGQPVAYLVDDDARLALQQAESQVVHLAADVVIAEANLAQLPSRIKAARANRNVLADEVRRKTALVDSGAVAAGPVERLAMKLDAADAALEQLQYEEQLLFAKFMDSQAGLAGGEAARDEAELRLSRMTVTSPIDGVVIERLTSPGSVIQFGNGEHSSHIVHIYQPDKLQVRADVPLANAAMVEIGQPAEVVVDILPDQVFEGVVTRFVHRADLSKNTIEAKVRIIEPSLLLKPDMLARVRILPVVNPETEQGMQRMPRTFAPQEAIDDGQIWIIESDNGDASGTARRRILTTGDIEHDGWVEVIDGLYPGDRVILDPDNLADGDRVISTGDDQ